MDKEELSAASSERRQQVIIDKLESLGKQMDSVETKVNPMFEAFSAWNKMTSWGKGVLWVIGAILGAVLAWKNIHKP